MCGIAGFVDFSDQFDEGLLLKMVQAIDHRGPDDSGISIRKADNWAIGLGHARLAILGLGKLGHQPMEFGFLSIVFNGEIYNFRELRSELESMGHEFYTATDTEVILQAYQAWGIECVQRFIGMFAFCLHDAHAGMIYLVRDRAGVKPLFVFQNDSFWLFASELKALHECTSFPAELDVENVVAYFANGYVGGNHCIFKDCSKVDAGEYWALNLATKELQKVRYWSAIECYRAAKLKISYSEALDELEGLIHSACSYRLVSDVPVGVFLSGGYDSTAVAAILQSRSSSKISTFTIGFSDGVDEAPLARSTARYLGTEHHELYCSALDAKRVIPQLATVFDEPFADSSAIPTILVSQLARGTVKVAISADGGDELFCGYDSYRLLQARMRIIARIPKRLRGILGPLNTVSQYIVPHTNRGLSHRVSGLLAALSQSNSLTGQNLHAYSRQLPSYYLKNIFIKDAKNPALAIEPTNVDDSFGIEGAMALDYSTYLKDDILVKVDRATMSVGLEGREPLVDHRLLEFSARLPLEFKFDGHETKRILKEMVHRYVPAKMMQRPKRGFSLPIMSWLRSDLSWLLDEYCSETALRTSGLFDEKFLRQQIGMFRSGRLYYTTLIWRLLVFQMWHQRWLGSR